MKENEELLRYICEKRRIPCHLDLPEHRLTAKPKRVDRKRLYDKLEELEMKRSGFEL